MEKLSTVCAWPAVSVCNERKEQEKRKQVKSKKADDQGKNRREQRGIRKHQQIKFMDVCPIASRVCLSACLPACLPTCLPICSPVSASISLLCASQSLTHPHSAPHNPLTHPHSAPHNPLMHRHSAPHSPLMHPYSAPHNPLTHPCRSRACNLTTTQTSPTARSGASQPRGF